MRKYYVEHDFYNLKSDKMLTILTHFPTYQQTTLSTCGPSSLLMVMKYFGIEQDEMYIAKQVKCKIPGGTKIRAMEKYLTKMGFEIFCEQNLERGNDGKFFDFDQFKKFVIENLKNGFPIIIENVESGDHYRTIIGYDELSQETGNFKNDMLIMADSADTYDTCSDGYNFAPAYRTFKMWFDDHHLPKSQKQQPFIVVKGLKK